MEDNTLVQSSFSATINAPIEKIDIPSWCFTLPESEYQSCSPAHCSAGATTSPDGRRMSINVEVRGGSMIVQHYVEEIGQPDHLRLVSTSDVFTPGGRTKIGVIWDLAARKIVRSHQDSVLGPRRIRDVEQTTGGRDVRDAGGRERGR